MLRLSRTSRQDIKRERKKLRVGAFPRSPHPNSPRAPLEAMITDRASIVRALSGSIFAHIGYKPERPPNRDYPGGLAGALPDRLMRRLSRVFRRDPEFDTESIGGIGSA